MSGVVTVAGTNPTSLFPENILTDGAGALRVTSSGGVTPTVGQGSTTAGQSGNLVQGAVTTAAPTYTTAQTSPLSLDTQGNLRVVEASFVSTANSSSTPLGAAGVFTGTSVSTLGSGSIAVSVLSSHASATDGLSIQQSTDGTNWDITDVYTIAASGNFLIPVKAAFARVVYTNGGTLQTTFRLQTTFKPQMPVASAFRPADAMGIQNDFPAFLSINQVYNGTTIDLTRSAVDAADTVGTGIQGVAALGQLDDTTTSAVTENRFANARIGPNHGLVVNLDGSLGTSWNYAGITGGILNSTADVVLQTAAAAGFRRYIKTLTIDHDLLASVTECVLKDATTVIWRGKLQTPALEGRIVKFDPPLKTSAAAALNFALITAVATGGVYISAVGFTDR